jgi:hypothetical protein
MLPSRVCQTLTEHYEDLDASFSSARWCLEEKTDIALARVHLLEVQAAAEGALRHLDQLDSAHREAVAAGIDAADLAAAIVSGCAAVPDPNPAPAVGSRRARPPDRGPTRLLTQVRTCHLDRVVT